MAFRSFRCLSLRRRVRASAFLRLVPLLLLLVPAVPGTAIADPPAASGPPASYDAYATPGGAAYGSLLAGREVSTRIFHRWISVLRRHRAPEPASGRLCASTDARRCGLWVRRAFLARYRDASAYERIDRVNRYVNKSPYVGDWANWGTRDYWATPAEFFAMGGDCEDFAIAKYFLLRELGFGRRNLKIVVVHDTERNQAHAVLVVTSGAQAWMLDSRDDRIVPWATVHHYQPIYSLDERSAWLHTPPPMT